MARLRAAWPAVVILILATAAATAWLNWQRPSLRLDLGEGRDHQFIDGFHDRETAAIGGAQATDWPRGTTVLSVPGGYRGVVLARLAAADDADGEVLAKASAVAVNGVRVVMPRRSPREIWAKIPAELAAAPTLQIELVSALVGDPPPPADQIASVETAPAQTYRWTTAEAELRFAHVGRGSALVTFDGLVHHSDNSAVNARLTLNGVPWLALPEAADVRRYRVLAPGALLGDGQLQIGISAATFADPRPLGLLLFDVSVEPLRGTLPDLLPAWRSWLPLLVIVAAAAIVTASVTAGFTLLPAALRHSLPTAAALVLLGAGTAWLSIERLAGGWMIDRLAVFSLLVLVLLEPLRRMVERLLRTVDAGLPAWVPGAVMGLFWVGMLLKGVGMLAPAYMGIDVHWHMDKARDILFEGALPNYYGVNSTLNDITMPTAEWGENPPVIPYSPWFHMLATVYALLPWPMELTASVVALLMDLSRIPLLAALTRTVSSGWRAPLLAAALITVVPVTFLLHNWGNVPTAAGLWLSWLVIAYLWLKWPRLHERRSMIELTLLLVATFLIYTVTGVFTGVFLVLLTVLVWLNGRRGGEWAALRDGLRPLWTAGGAAILLVLAIYYGQYIGPILSTTVPYLLSAASEGPQGSALARASFASYALDFLPHLGYWLWPGRSLYYGLLLPLLAMPFGYAAIRRVPIAWLIAAAWGSVGLLFFVAGYRISMVDKQLFYLVPLIALSAGLAAERPGRFRRAADLLIAGLLVLTLLSALWLWSYRISIAPVYF